MAEDNLIIADTDMFSKAPAAKTAEVNIVAKKYGISNKDLAGVEDYKKELTEHNVWDLPFMGYVNEDGYGYAYVPDAAVAYDPYWDSHKAFLELPEDVQAALAIRLLFAHRPVDRYGASMFLHHQRGFNVKFEGVGANNY